MNILIIYQVKFVSLPKSISKRISEILNEEIFKQSVPIYQKALKDSGLNENVSITRKR